MTSSLIPAAHNTGGSLPDLTNIQIPSPLPTPLDPDDSSSSLSASNSTGNLANTHMGLTSVSQGDSHKHQGSRSQSFWLQGPHVG